MQYPFPHIEHVDQVREAIAGREEFYISEKPEGFLISMYNVNMHDTFPPVMLDENGNYASEQDKFHAIRRECKGIKFDPITGKVLARPLHKFFNLFERPETQLHDLNLNKLDFWILNKLDGSMIHPILCGDKLLWCTKRGVTDFSAMVDEFIEYRPEYEELARYCINMNCTPIFEFCSRQNRIVIDYPITNMVLLAIRENDTGKYWPLSAMENVLNQLCSPIHRVHHKHFPDVNSFDEWLQFVRDLKGEEGFVIRFFDGHSVKVKAEHYMKIHKNKEALVFEKDVLDLILSDKADDLKPFLTEPELDRLNKFEKEFWFGIKATVTHLNDIFAQGKENFPEKKDFAIKFANTQTTFKQILFQMFDGKDARDIVIDLIKKNLSSQTRVDGVRYLFNTSY